MTGVARTRIGRVTLKGGADLRVLHSDMDHDRRRIERLVRAALDSQGSEECRGFAFVVWDAEGASTATIGATPGSCIPTILIPDFVRNRLLAERIETWTIETVNESWGHPPSSGT